MANEDEDDNEIISPAAQAQLWLIYSQAFLPAVVEAVKRGFVADVATATTAQQVAARFWMNLLDRSFAAGLRRGADIGVETLRQELQTKLGGMPTSTAEATKALGTSPGELIACLRNNSSNKIARAVIGNATCGELLAMIDHRCRTFERCGDCDIYNCTECKTFVSPADVSGEHTVQTHEFHCGCLELREARKVVVH